MGLLVSAAITQNAGHANAVSKTGNGSLILTSANSSWTTGLALNAGVLVLDAASTGGTSAVTAGPLGTGTLAIASGTTLMAGTAARSVANPVSVGGNFAFGGSASTNSLTLSGPINLGSALRVLTVESPQVTATLGGIVSGSAGGLTKSGNGILVLTPQTIGALSAAGAASNATLANTTTLTLSADAVAGVVAGMKVHGLGIAPGTTVASVSGTAVTLSQNALSTNNGGNYAFGDTQTYAPASGASGATSLTVTLAQAATLAVGSTVTGAGIAASSTVTAVDTATGVVTLNNALTANVAGRNITFGGATAVASFNDYAGATVVNGGLLRLGVRGALPDTTALSVLSGGALDLGGFSSTVGSLAGDSASAGGLITNSTTSGALQLRVGNATSTVFGGTITNNAGSTLNFIKQGSGALTLGGLNTYTGSTTVSDGTLSLVGAGQLPVLTAVNVSGAAAVFDVSAITPASITVGSLAGAAGSSVVLGAKGLVRRHRLPHQGRHGHPHAHGCEHLRRRPDDLRRQGQPRRWYGFGQHPDHVREQRRSLGDQQVRRSYFCQRYLRLRRLGEVGRRQGDPQRSAYLRGRDDHQRRYSQAWLSLGGLLCAQLRPGQHHHDRRRIRNRCRRHLRRSYGLVQLPGRDGHFGRRIRPYPFHQRSGGLGNYGGKWNDQALCQRARGRRGHQHGRHREHFPRRQFLRFHFHRSRHGRSGLNVRES
jgi:autotransporter-associated beta strand protein